MIKTNGKNVVWGVGWRMQEKKLPLTKCYLAVFNDIPPPSCVHDILPHGQMSPWNYFRIGNRIRGEWSGVEGRYILVA